LVVLVVCVCCIVCWCRRRRKARGRPSLTSTSGTSRPSLAGTLQRSVSAIQEAIERPARRYSDLEADVRQAQPDGVRGRSTRKSRKPPPPPMPPPPSAQHHSAVEIQLGRFSTPPAPPTSVALAPPLPGAPQPYTPQLPAGWQPAFDGQNTYYWNPSTNETAWDLPTATATPGHHGYDAAGLTAAQSTAQVQSRAERLATAAEDVAVSGGTVNEVLQSTAYLKHVREYAKGSLQVTKLDPVRASARGNAHQADSSAAAGAPLVDMHGNLI
jgi:hypothetical protein